MKLAREMNNLNQIDVYRQFGHKNTSMLAKIEGGKISRSMRFTTTVRASRIYGVSIDFLFGESEDWERDAQMSQEHETSRWFESQMDNMRVIELNIMRTISKRIVTLGSATNIALGSSREVLDAFNSFVSIHPEVEDMRCSRVVNAIHNGVAAANHASAEVNKLGLMMRATKPKDPKNMDWIEHG